MVSKLSVDLDFAAWTQFNGGDSFGPVVIEVTGLKDMGHTAIVVPIISNGTAGAYVAAAGGAGASV